MEDFVLSVPVMDVNLNKEYNTGYMANMEAGAGTQDAYLGRLCSKTYRHRYSTSVQECSIYDK